MSFQPDVNLPKEINQLNQPYKGVVVNNKDPLQLRRVQVKVEGIIEGSDIKNLPWAAPAGGQSSGRRADLGSFNVPELYSVVKITFPNGDVYTPEYSDYTDELIDGQVQKLFAEDYPSTKGNIESDGSWDRQNLKQGYKEYNHSSGFYYQVDKSGNLMVNIPGNLVIKINGQLCVSVSDLISMFASNNIGLTSGKEFGIDVNGGNFGVKASKVISLQGTHVHLMDGVTFGTASSAKSVLDKAVEKITQRLSKINELKTLIKTKGTAAKQAVKDYANGLLGNKKS